MRKVLIPLLSLFGILFFGCGGDDDGGGTNPPPTTTVTRLVVDTTVAAPTLSDVDELWAQIDSVEVTVGAYPDTYGRNGTLGERKVYLKAIKKADKLYIRAQWHDPTANILADYNKTSDDQNHWERVTSFGQDMFGIIFDAQNNGTEMADCATMCHATEMYTTGGGNADVWMWNACALAPTRMAEDKWMTDSDIDRDNQSNPTSQYPFRVNYDNFGLLPLYMHADTLGYTGRILYIDDIVDFTNTNVTWPANYILPGYYLDTTIFNAASRNSMNNVRAISHYDSTSLSSSDYTWTIVFERSLFTGNADDVNMTSLDSIQATIAVEHNERSDIVDDDHSGSKPFWIILK